MVNLNKKIGSADIEMFATRKGYGEGILELGAANENVLALTADLAESTQVLEFAKKYPMNILIAEDNVVNQKLAAHILIKMGYAPDLATNGHEAINALIAKKYNLVFMDVQMPEMDGLEATRFIRSNMEFQPMIVAMTANAMPEDKDVCLASGMDGYLSKPMKIAEIIEVLEECGKNINHGLSENIQTP